MYKKMQQQQQAQRVRSKWSTGPHHEDAKIRFIASTIELARSRLTDDHDSIHISKIAIAKDQSTATAGTRQVQVQRPREPYILITYR